MCVCVPERKAHLLAPGWVIMGLAHSFDPLQVQCAIFLWPTLSVLAASSYTVDKNNTAAIFAPKIAERHTSQAGHFYGGGSWDITGKSQVS